MPTVKAAEFAAIRRVSRHSRVRARRSRIAGDAAPLFLHIFETNIGWMMLLGHDDRVSGLWFGYRSRHDALHSMLDRMDGDVIHFEWNSSLAERLCRYAEGTPDDFRDVKVDFSNCTSFQATVLACCREIPYGRTATYAGLAAKAGFPGAARAAGNAMSQNRVALIIPCHRVIAAGGRLGGYSATSGVRLKQRLLDLESAGLNL